MKKSTATDQLKWLSSTAGMNQRYHQKVSAKWALSDRWTKIIVGFLTFGGAIFSSVSLCVPTIGWSATSLAVAILSAVSAVLLNVVPFGEWQQKHLDLFVRWSDLRRDVDTLLQRVEDQSDEIMPFFAERVQDVYAKKNVLNSQEPVPNDALLMRCLEDENQTRFAVRTQAERDAQLTAQSQNAAGAAA